MKYFLSAIILFCFLLKPSAQYFKGGIFAGITASQIDGDMLSGYNKPGLMTGFWVGRNINKNLSYRAELKYVMKGAHTNKPFESYPRFTKTLHYFELPIVFQYKLTSNINLNAGLAAAYLGYATVNIGEGPKNATSTMKNYEISTLIGFDYRFNEKWFIFSYFSYSLFPISNLLGNNYNLWRIYGQFNNILGLAFFYTIN